MTITTTRRQRRLLALTTAVALAAGAGAACGDDDSDSGADTTDEAPTTDPPASEAAASEAPTTEAPTTEAAASEAPTTESPTTEPATTEPATTEAPATESATESPASGDGTGDLPPTPAVAVLDNAYTFSGVAPEPAALPAPVGEVEAHWYRNGEVLAVVYVGLDPEVDACPGNSANTEAGFVSVSNAALPNGSCDEFPTLIESTDTQGIQLCDGRVGYRTLIPADTVGQLFASVERPDPDPTVQGVGITGFVEALDPTTLPELTAEQLAC